MAPMGTHEQKTARRDHLWVLVVIAVCALAEVWGSWVGIGSISGFPVLLGKLPTDWILAMVMEGYWAYGLYAWLAASPGPRSRSFAMWSCGVIFVLSLVGQVTYHEMTVTPDTSIGRRVVVGFVTILPVTGLALIAILIHLRHADREDIAVAARAKAEAEQRAARARAEAERQAAIERAEADERTWLRAELERVTASAEEGLSALREELTGELEAERTARASAQRDLQSAQREAAGTLARAAKLEARIAALSAPQAGKGPKAADAGDALEQETNLLRAQMEIWSDPSLAAPRMGGELARRLNLGASTGRRLHGILTENGRLKPEYERSAEGSGASAQAER